MKKIIIFSSCAFFALAILTITTNLAKGFDQIYISGVQTSGGPGLTINDFIELFNPSKSFDKVSTKAKSRLRKAIFTKSWGFK